MSDCGPEFVVGSFLPKSFSLSILFSAFTTACVHGFFAFRISVFTNKVYISSILWLMTLVLLLGRIVMVVISLQATSFVTVLIRWEWLITFNWGLSAATDLRSPQRWGSCSARSGSMYARGIITVVFFGESLLMTVRTAALVDKLIVWTIETGILTGLVLCSECMF
ncbi:hypothetical protein K438DRAFT_1981704 [Mycena galopus ATCC 62051]|nr:hypothetical protein K438DRAFT_1981704 [Mycena galopus ATCC 62051]